MTDLFPVSAVNWLFGVRGRSAPISGVASFSHRLQVSHSGNTDLSPLCCAQQHPHMNITLSETFSSGSLIIHFLSNYNHTGFKSGLVVLLWAIFPPLIMKKSIYESAQSLIWKQTIRPFIITLK